MDDLIQKEAARLLRDSLRPSYFAKYLPPRRPRWKRLLIWLRLMKAPPPPPPPPSNGGFITINLSIGETARAAAVAAEVRGVKKIDPRHRELNLDVLQAIYGKDALPALEKPHG